MKLKDHGIDVIDRLWRLANPLRYAYERICKLENQEFFKFITLYEPELKELGKVYEEYAKLFGAGAPISPDMLLGEDCIYDLLWVTEGGWDGHYGSCPSSYV